MANSRNFLDQHDQLQKMGSFMDVAALGRSAEFQDDQTEVCFGDVDIASIANCRLLFCFHYFPMDT